MMGWSVLHAPVFFLATDPRSVLASLTVQFVKRHFRAAVDRKQSRAPVVTLHLPRVLGLYGIPGAPHNPN
jgi:hypothetical protein